MVKYWVERSGNWSDNTNHWSDSSGGSPGATAPGASDDCVFDSSSGSPPFTVTVDTTVTILSMDWSTVLAGSKSLARTSGLVSVTGNVTFASGVSVTNTSFAFSTPSGNTSIFNPNGATMSGLTWSINLPAADSTVKLAGNFTKGGTNGINIVRGIFDTDGYDITTTDFFSQPVSAGLATLYLRDSIIQIGTSSANGILINSDTILDAGTSTFVIRSISNGAQITIGGHTYNKIQLSGGSAANPTDFIDQGYTIAELIIDAGKAAGFEPSVTESYITTLTAIGTSGSHIKITYKTPGTAGTYALCITTNNVDYADIDYLDDSCSANPIINPHGIDNGNNTNVIFAHWWEGIEGTFYKKPQVDSIISSKPQVDVVSISKPQVDNIETFKPPAGIPGALDEVPKVANVITQKPPVSAIISYN